MAVFLHNNKTFTVDVYDKNTDKFIDERITHHKFKYKSRRIKKVAIRYTDVCKPFSQVVWNIFRNEDHSLTLGLFENQKVVGVATFDFKKAKKRKVVVLDGFCVHEKFRGKGISDIFIQIAITLAKTLAKTNNVILYASTMGKKFYQRNGFEKLKGRQFSIWANALYTGMFIARTGKGQGYDNKFYGAMKLNNKKLAKVIHANEKSNYVL